MKSELSFPTKNKDAVVSWVYTWSRQQQMSIHEQRIVLRILEKCQHVMKGIKMKDSLFQIEHGLFDVELTIPAYYVFFDSNIKHQDVINTLDSLEERVFYFDNGDDWEKCRFINNPKYKRRSGLMEFRIDNKLWDVFMDFSRGYREFELNKALMLPTSYALRLYLLMSGQKRPFFLSVEQLKDKLGIPSDKYKTKDGKDRIDNLEERILKPAQKALDEACPYSFTYTKVREVEGYKRSPVKGFNLTPVYIPKNRDTELEKMDLQAKVSARSAISPHIYDYLTMSMGWTKDQISRNKNTLLDAQETIPDLIGELADLRARSRTADNQIGWVVNALKAKIAEAKK